MALFVIIAFLVILGIFVYGESQKDAERKKQLAEKNQEHEQHGHQQDSDTSADVTISITQTGPNAITVSAPVRLMKNTSNPKGHLTLEDKDTPDPNAIVLEGGVHRKIYVYDDRPFHGITTGHGFYLDLIGHDITMRSVTTGGKWNSAAEGDQPLSYKGQPIGFINVDSIPELKAAARLKHIQILAMWPGGVVSGVTRVIGLLPSNKKIIDTITEKESS
jgi:hypothetical protein